MTQLGKNMKTETKVHTKAQVPSNYQLVNTYEDHLTCERTLQGTSQELAY